MQQTNARAKGGAGHAGTVSQVGLIAAIAALVGASCCALPLALAWLGLAGAWIANLAIFVVYRPYITAFAIIVIAFGWAIALRRRASPRTFIVLGIASVVVAMALLIAHHETELTRYLIALRRK
ncbi:MAG: mercuric transporter MerT family protein [Hyphomicrobiaceae bacterium]